MKKRMFALLLIAVFSVSLLTACAPSETGNDGRSVTPMPTDGNSGTGQGSMIAPGNTGNISVDNLLTEQQAKQIALEHVQLTEKQVTGIRVQYDFDDGIPEYDVEFYYDGMEYEFEIHAQTGKILSFEKDR